ncbi:MAG: hypothetical protein CL844_03835 [Crocinitomicaceae bacterium]|nr:hypothetical protein [Crocinitomicaceae bacterium]
MVDHAVDALGVVVKVPAREVGHLGDARLLGGQVGAVAADAARAQQALVLGKQKRKGRAADQRADARPVPRVGDDLPEEGALLARREQRVERLARVVVARDHGVRLGVPVDRRLELLVEGGAQEGEGLRARLQIGQPHHGLAHGARRRFARRGARRAKFRTRQTRRPTCHFGTSVDGPLRAPRRISASARARG